MKSTPLELTSNTSGSEVKGGTGGGWTQPLWGCLIPMIETQGSRTLGWITEPRWGSRGTENAGKTAAAHLRAPTPYSLLPTPYSLLPTPYSLLPTPYSLLPHIPPKLEVFISV